MRHFKFLIASASLFGALILYTAPAALAEDKVFLENGDQFSGEIISYDQDQIVIKTVYGAFDIPLRYIKGAYTDNQVEGLEIAQSLAAHEREDGVNDAPLAVSALTAMPPVDANNNVAASQGAAKPEQAVKPDEDSYKNFWGADYSGNVNLGFDMKRGNSETEALNLDATLMTRIKKHDFKLRGEYNREEDSGIVNTNDRALAFGHDYNFTDQWFIGSKIKLEQDDPARLDIRSTVSTGLGYHWIQREDLSVKFVAGPGYIYEEFEDGSDDAALTYNWAFDYNQKFYDDLFRLFHEHSLITPADDTDAYLFESRTGLRVPIRKGIVVSGQVDYDWDNAPAQGSKEDDTTYSLKLGYEWP